MWWYAGAVVVAMGVILFRRHRGRGHARQTWLLRHGAARCHAAVPALRAAARRPDTIPDFWERAELPLVEALPDCAPDDKAALVAACEQLAQATRNRDTARRIMTVRNSLC